MGLIDTCNLIQQLYEYNKIQMNTSQHFSDIQNLEKKIVYEISKVNFSENLPAMLVFNKLTENDLSNFIKSEVDLFENEIKTYDANYSNWKYIDEKDFRNNPTILSEKTHDPLIPILNNLKPIKTTTAPVVSPLKTHRYLSMSNIDNTLSQQTDSTLYDQIDGILYDQIDGILYDQMNHLLSSFGS